MDRAIPERSARRPWWKSDWFRVSLILTLLWGCSATISVYLIGPLISFVLMVCLALVPRFPIGLLALFILLVCLTTIPRFPFGPLNLYGDKTAEVLTEKVSYEVLSTEQAHPYLPGRSTLNRDIKAAITRWPDARSCLVSKERQLQKPDLRLIDWDQFSTSVEVNVCLWRIFRSFGTVEDGALKRARNWFQFHTNREIWSPRSSDGVQRMGISWRTSETGLVFPTSGIMSLFGFMVYSESVTATWRPDGTLRSVNFGHQIT